MQNKEKYNCKGWNAIHLPDPRKNEKRILQYLSSGHVPDLRFLSNWNVDWNEEKKGGGLKGDSRLSVKPRGFSARHYCKILTDEILPWIPGGRGTSGPRSKMSRCVRKEGWKSEETLSSNRAWRPNVNGSACEVLPGAAPPSFKVCRLHSCSRVWYTKDIAWEVEHSTVRDEPQLRSSVSSIKTISSK